MKQFMSLIEEATKKWSKDVKIKGGAMHKALGIDPKEKLTAHYTSGAKLAKDLIKAVGRSKTAKMIAFAANIKGGKDDLFDKAQSALKKIKKETVAESTEASEEAEQELQQVIDSGSADYDLSIDSESDFEIELNKTDDNTWEVTSKYIFHDEDEAQEFYGHMREMMGLELDDETESEEDEEK